MLAFDDSQPDMQSYRGEGYMTGILQDGKRCILVILQMVIALSCGAFEKHTLPLIDVRQMHDETFYKGYIKYLSEVDLVFQKVNCLVSASNGPCLPPQ